MADGSVTIDTKLDQSGLEIGLKGLKGVVGKSLSGIAELATKGLVTSLAAGTSAVQAFGAYAISVGKEFESAFAGVKKTVDATEEELNTLRDGILEMSERMPQAASDIAAVAEAAGQLGIQTESILGFTETMVNLGVATNLTSEEAATQLARFANIVGMSQNDFDKLGSTVVALGNNLATTEAEIVSMAMRIASAGSQVGMSEDQIMALAGSLSSVGMAAEAGGSAISRVLIMMQLASEQGGDALTALADVAGMTSSQFAATFKQDATTALLAFLDGLNNAESSGKSALAVISELGAITELSAMDTIVVRDAILRAAGAGDLLSNSLDLANEAWNENTALTKEAEQRYATLDSQISMLKNSVSVFGIAVYAELKAPLAEGVAIVRDYVSQLDDAFAEGGFEGLAFGIGDVLSQAIETITGYLPTCIELGASVVTALVDGVVAQLDSISTAAEDVSMQFTECFVDLLPKYIDAGMQVLAAIAEGIGKSAPELETAIKDGLSIISQSFETNLPIIFSAGASVLSTLVNSIAESSPELVSMASSLLNQFLDGLAENIPMLAEAGLTILLALADGIDRNFESIIGSAIAVVQTLCETLLSGENSEKLVNAGLTIILSLLDGIVSNLDGLIDVALNVILFLCEQLISSENIALIVTTALEILGKLVTTIADNADEIFLAAETILRTLVTELTDREMLESLFEAGTILLGEIIIGLCQVAGKFLGFMWQLFYEIFGAIGEVDWGDIGVSIVDGIISGMLGVDFSTNGFLSGFASNWVTGLKSIFRINSPSKLMRDTIGKPLAEGIGVGFETGMSGFAEEVEQIVPTDFSVAPDVSVTPNYKYGDNGTKDTEFIDLLENPEFSTFAEVGVLKKESYIGSNDVDDPPESRGITIRVDIDDTLAKEKARKAREELEGILEGDARVGVSYDLDKIYADSPTSQEETISVRAVDFDGLVNDMLATVNGSKYSISVGAENRETTIQKSGDESEDKPSTEREQKEAPATAIFQLVVGGETIAEAIADDVDMRQGVVVEMKKRGMTR